MKFIRFFEKIGIIEKASKDEETSTEDDFKAFLNGVGIILFFSAFKLDDTISSLKTDIKSLLDEPQTSYAIKIISNIDSKIFGLSILLVADIAVLIIVILKHRKLKKLKETVNN